MSYQPPPDPQQPSRPQGEPTSAPSVPSYQAPPSVEPLGARAPLTLSNGATGTPPGDFGPAYGNGLPYVPANVPYGQPGVPYGWVAPPPAAKRKKLPFVLGGIGAVLALCLVGGVVAAAASDGSGSSSAAAQPSAAGPTAKATKKPATKPTTKPAAKPTTAPIVAEPVVTAQPVKTPDPTGAYRKLTAREWQLIVKNPDGHAGEKVIVYGAVVQFDSATGADLFLADAGYAQDESPSDARTLFTGDAGMLSDLVANDQFRAEAIVVGAESFDTQDGGNTTVPELQVTAIKIL
jgi:hypothetical protein